MEYSPTDFAPWPKIHRLRRDTIVTEKIDGTNGQVSVRPYGDADGADDSLDTYTEYGIVRAGSRKRWLQPGSKTGDNYGFGRWVADNAAELAATLGEGRHFGEWWGQGIARSYEQAHRHFSLFNVGRWRQLEVPGCPVIPELSNASVQLGVVPVLRIGTLNDELIDDALAMLAEGTYVAPVHTAPEGIVVFHRPSQTSFKVLCENDEIPKGTLTRYPTSHPTAKERVLLDAAAS